MDNRKKIIVPIDFSETAHNAYLYARDLAKVYNCKIEIVHVYSEALSTGTVLKYIDGKSKSEVLEKKVQAFVDNHPVEFEGILTKVDIDVNIELGATIPLLIQKSKAADVFMIIMGATGEHSIIENVIGSVSSRVAQEAFCPVLLVPNFARFDFYNNILYASNYDSVEAAPLQKIIDFAEIFRAAIHFIHVVKPDDVEDFTTMEEKVYNQLFKDGDPGFAFHMASIPATSVQQGLNQYAKENEVDLVVIVNRQRRFLETVFEKSLSKKMALDIKYPVLVYHLPDEERLM